MTQAPRDADGPRAGEEVVERFRPTSGRVTGVLALVLAGAVVLIGALDRERGFAPPVMAFAALGGVLAWASMLRPGLWVTREHLVMRNMLETVRIPLAAIEEIAVRQVLAVRVGESRHVSTVVGKSWRKALRTPRPGGPGAPPVAPATPVAEPAPRHADMSYPDFVEERIRQLADDARAAAGVRRFSDEHAALADGVQRRTAWPVVGLIGLAVVLVVVALVV